MFIKIIKDGFIVDTMLESEAQYVKINPITQSPIACKKDDADCFGILSSDSSVIYATSQIDGYDMVATIVYGDQNEYDEIVEELANQRSVSYTDRESEDVNITVLKTVIAQQQTDELLLLMSQIVNDLSDEDIVKYPSLVESWQEGVSYEEGKRLSYNNSVYKVIRCIKTSGATPDNSAAYYQAL